MAFDLRIDVAVDLHQVGPAVVVVIKKRATPGNILIVDANAGGESDIGESAVAVVAVKIASVVGEIGFKDVEPAVAIVVGNRNAHAGLLMAVVAICAAGQNCDVRKCAVAIVLKKNAGLRIHGNINVRPAVIVEIVGDRGNGIAASRFQNAGFFGNVGKSAVAVIAIKNVGVAGQT